MPNSNDMSKDDQIAIIKLGIKEEISFSRTEKKPRLDIELNNEKKACDIVFKFIAFKPPPTLPEGCVLPRRIFCSFQFFTFGEVRTDIMRLKAADGSGNPIERNAKSLKSGM